MAIQNNEDFSLSNKELFAAVVKSDKSIIDAVEDLTDLEQKISNPKLFKTPEDSPQGFVGNLGEMKCGRYLKYIDKAPDFWVGAYFDGLGNFELMLSIFESESSTVIAKMLKDKDLDCSSRYIKFNEKYSERWYTVSLPKSLIFKSSADLKDEIDKIII